jgi:lysophospholipid acyltransferase (LPLAT)-like uncharacterized protein
MIIRIIMSAAKDIKYFLILKLLTNPAYHFLNLYTKTIKLTFEGTDMPLNHIKSGGLVLFACWHQRFFGGFYFPRIYKLEPCIMISRSRDGDFIAAVVQRLGWRPVRGSSTSGGKNALIQMIQSMAKQRVGAHIVDGPLGPPHIIKPGLVTIAQKSGAVICPGYVTYEKPWIIGSWDRFMIPKPFSKVHIRFGSLMEVPENLSNDAFNVCLRRLESELIKGYDDADRCWNDRSGKE